MDAQAGRRTESRQRTAYWWSALRAPGGAEPPPSVVERLSWYERQKSRARAGFYVSEVVIVLLSASVPAAVAMDAPGAVTGSLGAGVAAAVGLRQLFRWGENWIRTSASMVALQQHVIAWSLGSAPYDGPGAQQLLAGRVEELVLADTATWSAMRSPVPVAPEPGAPTGAPTGAAPPPGS
ncbi:DUF4231 domain-containing protein [Streptomyces sp. N2-109]|uniref:DUF4231 domain-containing protein n=1 Tax=Streptomyces gossypii TaxID=2883101 RepID=A0ABT2K382_9ACTN|nr:DUF4231 domain-containing protein [Streptomyces gossypii]MCT2594629.1 DUF4231 domain-containing protein [Streptomyces gossypii]